MPLDRLSPSKTDTLHIKPSKDGNPDIIHKPSIKLTASETSLLWFNKNKSHSLNKPSLAIRYFSFLGEEGVRQTNRISTTGSWTVSRCVHSSREQ